MNEIDEIKKTIELLNPELHWGEDEFFYSWKYSLLSEKKERYYKILQEKKYLPLLEEINKFDELVKSSFEEWRSGSSFKALLKEINKKKKELLLDLKASES